MYWEFRRVLFQFFFFFFFLKLTFGYTSISYDNLPQIITPYHKNQSNHQQVIFFRITHHYYLTYRQQLQDDFNTLNSLPQFNSIKQTKQPINKNQRKYQYYKNLISNTNPTQQANIYQTYKTLSCFQHMQNGQKKIQIQNRTQNKDMRNFLNSILQIHSKNKNYKGHFKKLNKSVQFAQNQFNLTKQAIVTLCVYKQFITNDNTCIAYTSNLELIAQYISSKKGSSLKVINKTEKINSYSNTFSVYKQFVTNDNTCIAYTSNLELIAQYISSKKGSSLKVINKMAVV
eukprot:TRINITY_DN8938_c0_g1_i1.p1 TRINITY_DN8938_c0_g1~~TRINITY_DN8938_c0_g1_i1.p1  ORF type:complete len:287 (-),score=-9.14 TRINITY_DN8938_c0_g1_i1:247-1107(-)